MPKIVSIFLGIALLFLLFSVQMALNLLFFPLEDDIVKTLLVCLNLMLFGGLCLGVMACGPMESGMKAQKSIYLGPTKEITDLRMGKTIELPYVFSGDPQWQKEAEEEQKALDDASGSASDMNGFFARSIYDVIITKKISPNNHFRVQIFLSTKDSPIDGYNLLISFRTPNTSREQSDLTVDQVFDSKNQSITLPPEYLFKAQLKCHNSACSKARVTLSQYNHGDFKGSTTIVYSSTPVTVTLEKEVGKTDTLIYPEFESKFNPNHKLDGVKRSVRAINGYSFAKVTVPADNSGNLPLIDFRTEIVPTNLAAIRIQYIRLLGQSPKIATLNGHNQSRGDIIVDVEIDSPVTENHELIRLRILPKGFRQETTLGHTPNVGEVQKFAIPVDQQNTKWTKTSRNLSQYNENHTKVKEYIQMWTCHMNSKRQECQNLNRIKCHGSFHANAHRKRAEEFFKNVQPLLKPMEKVYKSVQVTPETTYLMASESNYAIDSPTQKNPRGTTLFDGDIVNPVSSAAGPFQLLTQTAQDVAKLSQEYLPDLDITLVIRNISPDQERKLAQR